MPFNLAIGWLLIVASALIMAQGLFTLYLMLYSWWQPDRLEAANSRRTFLDPATSFTVLVPARHEKDVIYDTLRRILAANYPPHLMEILVICQNSDRETIAEARRAFEKIDSRRVGVITFSDGPVNKPHGLNIGLRAATNDVVTVFDAEDDIHPNIFNVANSILKRERVRVIQAGVQLMNHQSRWFSALNVLEYFFWYRSRLHFHARIGMIPMGGNTFFVDRRLLMTIGGWDEQCLTEDADLGVRLSVAGEPIRVVYDAEHVTGEETPASLRSFVRQRTRWNQGFLQVLAKGDWLRLRTLGQKALALYTLTYPVTQALMVLAWPLSLMALLRLKMPIAVALPSLAPLYTLLFQLVINLLALWEFTHLYHLKFTPTLPLKVVLTFIPFLLVLGYSAMRAVYRALASQSDWEKTSHQGAHRAMPGQVAGVQPAVVMDTGRRVFEDVSAPTSMTSETDGRLSD